MLALVDIWYLPAHQAALDGRAMMRPEEADHWPVGESLDWQMEHMFRKR